MKEELNKKQLKILYGIKEAIEQYDYKPTNEDIRKLVTGNRERHKKLKKTIHRRMRWKNESDRISI